jgi:hypothetical protein
MTDLITDNILNSIQREIDILKIPLNEAFTYVNKKINQEIGSSYVFEERIRRLFLRRISDEMTEINKKENLPKKMSVPKIPLSSAEKAIRRKANSDRYREKLRARKLAKILTQ